MIDMFCITHWVLGDIVKSILQIQIASGEKEKPEVSCHGTLPLYVTIRVAQSFLVLCTFEAPHWSVVGFRIKLDVISR
jgi:hypothetical protein